MVILWSVSIKGLIFVYRTNQHKEYYERTDGFQYQRKAKIL